MRSTRSSSTSTAPNNQLNALQKGDPKAGVNADPAQYNERVKYLSDAYDALSTTWVSFFNYQKAAETYEQDRERTIASTKQKRRDAARSNAMVLYANIGQRDKMLAEYQKAKQLHPSAEDKANADYLVASFDYKQWDGKGVDAGANRQSRGAGEQALVAYVQTNRGNAGAGRFVVEAAYEVAKMKKVGGEADYHVWLQQTVTAWESYRAKNGDGDAQKPPYVDYAAEAAFILLDDEITQKFDVPSKHVYSGSVADVLGSTAKARRVATKRTPKKRRSTIFASRTRSRRSTNRSTGSRPRSRARARSTTRCARASTTRSRTPVRIRFRPARFG